MRIAGLLFSILTIAALNLILWIGASTDLPRPPWFGMLTGTMDLCLVDIQYADRRQIGPAWQARVRLAFPRQTSR